MVLNFAVRLNESERSRPCDLRDSRVRPRRRSSSAASVVLAASRSSETSCCRASTARTLKRIVSLAVLDVGVFALAAALAVAPERGDLDVGAGGAVDVGPAPGIGRQRLLQVGLHRCQPFLGGGVPPLVEAVLVQRLLERVDLRPRYLHLGLPDLREVPRRYVAGQQADEHYDHQQLEQREAVGICDTALHGYRPNFIAGVPASWAPMSGPAPVKLSLK